MGTITPAMAINTITEKAITCDWFNRTGEDCYVLSSEMFPKEMLVHVCDTEEAKL